MFSNGLELRFFLANSRLGTKDIMMLKSTLALGTQYLVLDDYVSDPLKSLLIYIIIVDPLCYWA